MTPSGGPWIIHKYNNMCTYLVQQCRKIDKKIIKTNLLLYYVFKHIIIQIIQNIMFTFTDSANIIIKSIWGHDFSKSKI